MKLVLHATPGEVMRAVEALQAFAQQHGASEQVVFALALGLEECAANVVTHALHGDATRTFDVEFERTGDTIAVELRDAGPEFDPTARNPRPPQAADDDDPGGWGVELVRRHVDEIHYRRVAGRNTLRLVKRLVSE